MAYQGPTFVETSEYNALQTRRFDEMTKTVELPSEPLRVRTETDRLDDMIRTVPLPSDEARVQLESSAFDELTKSTTLPSADLAPAVEAGRFDEMTKTATLPSQELDALVAPPLEAPAAFSPLGPVSPEGVSVSPGAPPDDDPVQKTLAYLKGLGGEPAPGGGGAVGGFYGADTGAVGGSFADEQDSLIPRVSTPPRSFAQDPFGAMADVGGDLLLGGIEEGTRQRKLLRSGSERAVETIQAGRPGEIDWDMKAVEPIALALTGEPIGRAAGKVAGEPGGGLVGAATDAGVLGARRRPGQMTPEELRAQIDETSTSPLWTDYFYHSAPEYTGGGLAPTGRGDQVWLNADAPVQRPGSTGLAIDKSKLDPTLLDTAPNGYPVYRGEIPPDAITVLGKMDHGGSYDGKTLHEAFIAAEGATPATLADGGGMPPTRPPTTAGAGPPEPPAAKPLRATLEQPMQPDVVLPGHQVTAVRRLWDRTRNILADQGDAGKELAERAHQWRDDWQVDAAAAIKQMPTVDKLSNKEMVNLVDVLERGRVGLAKNAAPMNDKVARAAVEARAVMDDVFARAQNAGVETGTSIENYFPHVYKKSILDQLKTEKGQRAVVAQMVESGTAATEREASGIIYRFLQAPKGDRRNGNLEMERLANMPGYEKTKEALYTHVADAYKRVHEVAQFGPKDAIANKLLDRIGQEGYDKTTAVDMYQTIVGGKTYDDLFQGVSRVARYYNSTTRLGLSVISNATQSGNTATVIGTLRTMQAMRKSIWSDAERAFADATGTTLEAAMKELRQGGGWSDKLGNVVRPGFNEVELLNRRVAAIGGRDFARDMAAKVAKNGDKQAIRALDKMGLDAAEVAKRGGKLTSEEEIKAARNIVERTQFYVDAQDLPGWTQSPVGKMVAQFRTFGYNQTAFVVREAIDEAKAGNAAPLVRLLIITPMLSAASIETRNVITGRPSEEDPLKRTAQYVLGPMGLVGDAARAVLPINAKYIPAERRASMALGTVLGPTAGTAADLATGAFNAASGNMASAGRTALRQVPVAGQLLTNRVFPYKLPDATPASRGGRVDTSRKGTRTDTTRKDSRR